MIGDLITFLRARLDEDVDVASDARGRRWHQPYERIPAHIVNEYGHDVTYGEALPSEYDAAHIVRHDPARVLREAEAKRQIIDECERQQSKARANSAKFVELTRAAGPSDDYTGVKTHGWELTGRVGALEAALKILALPYADRPDYREEWRP